MPHFVSTKDEIVQNMNDITSDFACLKVSALGKASRISGEIDQITIGPDSIINTNDTEKSENIENEQNSCNIKTSQKSESPKSSKISTQNGITFSAKKIQLEGELQRKEKVWKEVERRLQKMKENGRAIQEHMALSHSSMARERERKSAEKLAYILAEEERLAEQEEIRRKHEQQLHAQRAQEQKEKLKREVEEYRKNMKEKEELIKKVTSLKNDFGAKYYEITMLTKSHKDKGSVPGVLVSCAALTLLKEVCQQMEAIDEKCRTEQLTPADLNTAEALVQQISEILYVFKAEIERIDALTDANIPANVQNVKEIHTELETPKSPESIQTVSEAVVSQQTDVNSLVGVTESKDQITEMKPVVETVGIADSSVVTQEPSPTAANSTTNVAASKQANIFEYVSKESLQTYINSQELLENYMKNYKDFLESPATKTFRFECQKAINIPVNAISGINEQHLRDKYERLQSLLIGKSSPNVGQHPQGTAYCKDVLANKIISQGETLVSSKPEMAFPIAAVTVALWNDHPDLGDLLLAHFHKICPYTVPLFMPQGEGQSDEDYYKLLGYKYSEDGSVEKQDKFLKRMSGLMRLYASIMITTQRKGVTKPHPYGLQNAWKWLALILNTDVRPDTADLCATLILDMLIVAGNTLWNAYPKQFHKLLTLLMNVYYPRMKSVGIISGGSLVRLEEFLKQALTQGSIPPPEGQLPPKFW